MTRLLILRLARWLASRWQLDPGEIYDLGVLAKWAVKNDWIPLVNVRTFVAKPVGNWTSIYGCKEKKP